MKIFDKLKNNIFFKCYDKRYEMTSETKLEILSKISEIFKIDELCGGFSYSLKCKIDGTVNEHRFQKIKLNWEIPSVLCAVCSEHRIKNWDKIKRKCSKFQFVTVTTRKNYIGNGKCSIKCRSEHEEFEISNPDDLIFCEKCFAEKPFEKYLTKKCSKKFQKNFYYHTKNGYELGLVKLNTNCILESLNALIDDDFLTDGEKILIKLENFKKIKIANLLESVGFKISKKSEEILEARLTKEIGSTAEPVSDYFERDEKTQIFEKNFHNGIKVDFEIFQQEFLELVNEREKFMDDYYENLKNEHSIFNDEFNRKNYSILKSSNNYKYHQFESVPVCDFKKCFEKSGENPTYENVHDSVRVDQYMNRIVKDAVASKLNLEKIQLDDKYPFLKKLYGEKALKTFIVYPTYVEEIEENANSENIKLPTLVLEGDLLDVVETKEEKSAFLELLKISQAVKLEVDKYKNVENYKTLTLSKLIKKFQKLSEEHPEISECLLDTGFRVSDNNVEIRIDPSVVVALILLRNDPRRSPYQSYFCFENPIFFYDSNKTIYFGKSENDLSLVSQKWMQKKLYIDSGVAELMCKIIFNGLNFSKNNFDNLPELSQITLGAFPEEAFSNERGFRNVGNFLQNREIKINKYLDRDFDLLEFLNRKLFRYAKPSYEKRANMINVCTILHSKKITNRMYESSIANFWQKIYECEKSKILNSKEEEMLKTFHDDYARFIIKSEILNAFKKSIVKSEKCVFLGTIENPKYLCKKSEEISKKDYMRLCCALQS